AVLLDGAEGYRAFASEYYEVDLDLEAVRDVYALRPLTPELVARLNPDTELADLFTDLSEIGFPLADRH
ncbi:MAG: hypothetical protein ACRDVE_11105, partial [Actinocrinis sp.]